MKFELQTLEEYTDEALLPELRRVAEALNGQRLTLERFNSLARVHSTTLCYRFGSWQAALNKAGGLSGERLKGALTPRAAQGGYTPSLGKGAKFECAQPIISANTDQA